MKVVTLKRHSMVPQIEASHIGAMKKLRAAYSSPESQAFLDLADNLTCELSERMGTCAGKAWTKGVGGKYTLGFIRLNARLLAINPDELIPTYLHELAHVVANFMVGRQAGHGPAWKMVMRAIGITDERCHSMDVTAFAKPQKRFSYTCTKCEMDFNLTKARHKKQQHGVAHGYYWYRCKCGGAIEHKP